MNKIFYIIMLIGFAGCSYQSPTLKLKIIGFLLLMVNALVFWN